MTDEKISNAIRKPTTREQLEVRKVWTGVSRSLKGVDANIALKVLAHALLFRAQFHGIPSTELVRFLADIGNLYLPKGRSELSMGEKARERLESGAGMPQWPDLKTRNTINRLLSRLYQATDSCPVGLQVRVFMHGLMTNSENCGMTHKALLLRLEVLDRIQRADGSAQRFIPDKPPSWAQGSKPDGT